MKTHARVVVIGGGVVGVSTLYHLAKKGWSDVTLLERTELTAGSTWHAAGLLPLFNMSYTVGQLHKYSVDLYKRLPEETGQEVSFHVTGNLRLATSRDRMDEYHKYCGTANTIGVPFRIISPAGSGRAVAAREPGRRRRHAEDRRRALPSGRRPHRAGRSHDGTAARRARGRRRDLRADRGAAASPAPRRANGRSRRTRATSSASTSCARPATMRARPGRKFGLDVPAIPGRAPVHRLRRVRGVEGLSCRAAAASSPCCANRTRRTICARSASAGSSARTRRARRRASPTAFPREFGKELFAGDLDRLLPHVEAAMKRVPCLEHAGIKTIVNGPISYTPDGSPLVGPAWGVQQSSGSTKATASASPPRAAPAGSSPNGSSKASPASTCWRSTRAGSARTRASATPSGRTRRPIATSSPSTTRTRSARTRGPPRRAPSTRSWTQMGAVWGQRYGWERANWFAPPGVPRKDDVELPAQQLFRARRQRMPADARQRGRDRPHAVHEARGDGPGRRGDGSTRSSRTRCR